MNIQPHKVHLSKLPDIDRSQMPPRPSRTSKRGIVLLPLFEGHPGRDIVNGHAAISACWAWRTWRLFTDVDEYGIAVKFYIEEKVRDSAMPILERNFVEEQDIIWHQNGELLERGPVPIHASKGHTGGSKKVASYLDERFIDYDWIFDVDGDIFIMSPNGEKLPFFCAFFDNCEEDEISVSWTTEHYETPFDLHWCRHMNDKQLKTWRDRAEELTSREIVESYFDPEQLILCCNGGIVAVPTKHFMAHRRWDLEFIVKASQRFADQEVALSFYHALGNPLFEIFPLIKTDNFSDRRPRDYKGLKKKYLESDPFLLHYYSTQPTSHQQECWNMFYQGIGVQ